MAKQTMVQQQVDEDRAPDQPTKLGRHAWPAVLKRTVKEYKADNLPDLAAALTYYAVLAIFPMLIVLVSVLGLIGNSVTQPLIDNLGEGRARRGQADLHERDHQHPEEPGHRGRAGDRRARRRAVVGIGLRRRVHAGFERRVGRRGGPADLENDPRAHWRDRGQLDCFAGGRNWDYELHAGVGYRANA